MLPNYFSACLKNNLLQLLLIIKFELLSGLHFHVVGEGVIRMQTRSHGSVFDRENYIDFRMRLFGEQGNFS